VFNGMMFKFATDVEVTRDSADRPIYLFGGDAPNDEFGTRIK
jgi:hypothetical protein